MTKYFPHLLLSLILFSFNSFAQFNNSNTDSTAQLIKNEEMKNSKVMEIASYLTDVYGPRLTYSKEYKQAADWASSKLKEWGMENVHFEKWGPAGKGWTLKSFFAEVTEPRTIPLIAYPKAWSASLNGVIKGDVVWLNVKSEKDFDSYKRKLKGKFVLISNDRKLYPHFEPDAHRINDSTLLQLANMYSQSHYRRFRFPRIDMANFDSVFALFKQFRPNIDSASVANFIIDRTFGPKKLKFCMDEGAVCVLSISNGDDGTVFVQQASMPYTSGSRESRLSVYDPEAPVVIPQVVVSAENYNRMIRMIEKGEKLTMEMELKTEFTGADSAFNIIGEIPGTDKKDEIILIGGHFDSWHGGTGAADNASGAAVCMEAMRILKNLNLTPRRTIKIGLWAGEEEGLLGSRAYVDKHFGFKSADYNSTASVDSSLYNSEAKKELNNFSVYFNDDNGTGKFRGIYLQGNENAGPIFRKWLHEFNDKDAQTVTISNTGGTDHLSFDNAGLPGFQFIQDPLDYGVRVHHSNMDVYDRLQEADLKQAAEIIAFFAYKAAMMDNRFPRKKE
jgi:carboxypeptidase Q